MYKVVLTHEVMPGKLPDVIKWLKASDEKARASNAPHGTHYITVFGSAHKLINERELDEVPTSFVETAYAERTHNSELVQFLVPGRTEIVLLKKLET